MWVCDGNNSLWRMATVAGRRVADQRVFADSDYYLPVEYVDKYTNEVKARPSLDDNRGNDDNDNDIDEEDGGDPTDGSAATFLAACTKNWKAASAESKKQMWNVFDETGLFASACQHGFVLWIAVAATIGPSNKLPPELLSKIFEFAVAPASDDTRMVSGTTPRPLFLVQKS
ncbi:hypothetical protein VKT23_016587 [Stygiomarasmius scandens]|uniref:Uncharacterized protein n=1 Tax=Marasmiellus scandens TaxID=2682957 RepID=A0ABR1IU95_9AGAR